MSRSFSWKGCKLQPLTVNCVPQHPILLQTRSGERDTPHSTYSSQIHATRCNPTVTQRTHTSHTTQMHLLQLPDEVLIHIVSYLNCLSLLTFRLVSSHLCCITNDDDFLFSVPFLRIIPFRRLFTSIVAPPVAITQRVFQTSFLGSIIFCFHECGVSITFDKIHWVHFFDSNFVLHFFAFQPKDVLSQCQDYSVFLKDSTIVSLSSFNPKRPEMIPVLVFKRSHSSSTDATDAPFSIKFKWRVYHRPTLGLFKDLGIIQEYSPFHSDGKFFGVLSHPQSFQVAHYNQSGFFIVSRYDQSCKLMFEDHYRMRKMGLSGYSLTHYSQSFLMYQSNYNIEFFNSELRSIYHIVSLEGVLCCVGNGLFDTQLFYFYIFQDPSIRKPRFTTLFSFDPRTLEFHQYKPPLPDNIHPSRSNLFDNSTIVLEDYIHHFDPCERTLFVSPELKLQNVFTPVSME